MLELELLLGILLVFLKGLRNNTKNLGQKFDLMDNLCNQQYIDTDIDLLDIHYNSKLQIISTL